MHATRRSVAVGICLIVMTGLVTAGIAERSEDARNDSADYFDAVEGARCFSCHQGQGFQPMWFTVLTRYTELPIGEATDIELQIRHAGKMEQSLQDIAVTVDVGAAPNVQVLVDDFVPEMSSRLTATLTPDVPETTRLEVHSGAVAIEAVAEATSHGRPYDQGEALQVVVVAPDGKQFAGSGEALNKSVHVDESDLAGYERGDFRVELRYTHPVTELARPVEVEGRVVVRYGQEQTSFRFLAEDPDPIRGGESAERMSRVVKVPIVILSADEALLDLRAEAVNHWPHEPQNQAPSDEGLYYRFATMRIVGGDTAVLTRSDTVSVPIGPTVDLFTLFTRLLGFAAILLVPLAMVTGGLFGKGSRRWLNRFSGGAKKRVLWHNTMSFMIIGVATLHLVLALLEPGMRWQTGLFWGGVGWLILVSLGLTGWFQVRMIKRWDYRTWRHVHLWSAVGVFAFGILHMVFDGSDLLFVRQALPDWHSRLIWP